MAEFFLYFVHLVICSLFLTSDIFLTCFLFLLTCHSEEKIELSIHLLNCAESKNTLGQYNNATGYKSPEEELEVKKGRKLTTNGGKKTNTLGKLENIATFTFRVMRPLTILVRKLKRHLHSAPPPTRQ